MKLNEINIDLVNVIYNLVILQMSLKVGCLPYAVEKQPSNPCSIKEKSR